MAINCSDSNPTCGFCGEALAQTSQQILSIRMEPDAELFICENCHAFSSHKISHADLGPSGQANFHELIFGTDPTDFLSYINDAKLLRNVISNDYPNYFGDKSSELVFDVGAGRGSLLKALHDEGYSALGCEYSAKLVDAGRSAYKLPDKTFFQLNAWDLPKYFHRNSIRPTVLIFWHVIEHIDNCFSLLEPLVQACADKVTLIFQTPLPVPEYVFPEHIFFPTTETFHFIAERLGLSVKLLYIIPYTRYVTCVLSNKDVPVGKVYPKQRQMSCFSVVGQLIAQLDYGLQELDKVTKEQYQEIFRFESLMQPMLPLKSSHLTLASNLEQIADTLKKKYLGNNNLLSQKVQQLQTENQSLLDDLLRAEAQLVLLKDIFLNNLGEDSL